MGKKVLVIDDSPMILTDLQKKLSSAGYAVITREKSLGASQVVIDEKPDLIILDIKMPLVSGENLLQIFENSIPNLPPILVFSELSTDEIERICTESKATTYLQKSQKDQLLQKIAELIN